MPSTKAILFQQSCSAIAALLPGFKHRKTARTVERTRGDWTETLWFKTHSRINQIPDVVHLEIRASVRSEALKQWRDEHRIRLPWRSEYLFDGDIENFHRAAPPYIRYDVGDAGKQDRVIERVRAVLHEEILPLFDLVHDPVRWIDTLSGKDLPGLDASVVDVFLMHGDVDAARRFLDRVSSRSEDPGAFLAKTRAARATLLD